MKAQSSLTSSNKLNQIHPNIRAKHQSNQTHQITKPTATTNSTILKPNPLAKNLKYCTVFAPCLQSGSPSNLHGAQKQVTTADVLDPRRLVPVRCFCQYKTPLRTAPIVQPVDLRTILGGHILSGLSIKPQRYAASGTVR